MSSKNSVKIAIIGKYVNLKDAYKSLDEALTHGGIKNDLKINIIRIESDYLKVSEVKKKLMGVNGILIPGGFGKRGTEGKIAAINYARKNKIPFLGICFGMQMAVIEAARNMAGIKGASSTEFGETTEPVVGLMTEWLKGNARETRAANGDLGGTMRLGAEECRLTPGSKVAEVYGADVVSERHRHRWEFNNDYLERLQAAGLKIAGRSTDNSLVEVVEVADHPWFVACQFHPEFASTPRDAHPLFTGFVKAAVAYADR